MGNPSPTQMSVVAVERQDLRLTALELRRSRYSNHDIAAQLRIGVSTAYHYVQEALKDALELERHTAQELVRLELEELDHLQAVLADDVAAGDREAVLACLKVSESRRKLLGLDRPELHKAEITVREYVGGPVDQV